jgi:sugar phosphate isomerase/epimerase
LKVIIILIIVLAIIALCFIIPKIRENSRLQKIFQAHPLPENTDRNCQNPENKGKSNASAEVESASEQNPAAHTIPTGVQQIMIGSLCNSYSHALETLQNIKAAGYDSIELNDFMIHKSGFLVKAMTKMAGMPIGNGGSLDWHKLIEESGLTVISLHSDLGSIERDPDHVAEEALSFHTKRVVITGMYRFNYSDYEEVRKLADRLNAAGKALAERNIELLYHNHNCELQKVNDQETAYDLLIDKTDENYVNFEFDSYWMTDGGANVPAIMKKLGHRMKLWHINDRGCRKAGPYMTPILKENAMELGFGNMDLETLSDIARENQAQGVVLETHQNWVNNDPIESLIRSADFLNRHFH